MFKVNINISTFREWGGGGRTTIFRNLFLVVILISYRTSMIDFLFCERTSPVNKVSDVKTVDKFVFVMFSLVNRGVEKKKTVIRVNAYRYDTTSNCNTQCAVFFLFMYCIYLHIRLRLLTVAV